MVGESNKRKRGRKPKNPSSTETLDLPSTTTTTAADAAALDDVFSVTNVELIDPPTTSSNANAGAHRRGRPKKRPMPEKPQPLLSPSARRATLRPFENGDFFDVAVGPMAVEGTPARVVPAMDAVVKVFCVHTEPNFSLPWQRKRQYSSSSSGFVIGGRRVLTNAHSVEHYTQVKLKKRGSDTKYLATVLAIGTECDIGN